MLWLTIRAWLQLASKHGESWKPFYIPARLRSTERVVQALPSNHTANPEAKGTPLFASTILEVAIGIFFVFALVSIIATAANELIASLMKWRGSTLVKGIRNLLQDHAGTGLAKSFYDHPLIKGLSEKGKPPSYVPSRTFALAVLDIVAKNNGGGSLKLADIRAAVSGSAVNQAVKDAIVVLIDSAANDLRQGVSDFGKVQENIEIWFNNSMDRVSGWYKRQTQALLFLLCAVFTLALNVDTIHIVKSLSTDSALRTAIVEQANKLAEHQPTVTQGVPAQAPIAPPLSQTDKEIIQETKEAKLRVVKSITDLQKTGVPIGWESDKNFPNPCKDPWWWLLKLLGLGCTVVAASLGAPFWFDILNKFITIRSSGKAPEETPKSPKEVPVPLEPGQLPGLADALRSAMLVVPGAAAPAQPPPPPPPPPATTGSP